MKRLLNKLTEGKRKPKLEEPLPYMPNNVVRENGIFGKGLEALVVLDQQSGYTTLEVKVPRIIEEFVEWIEREEIINIEGIYRVTGTKRVVQQLRCDIDANHNVDCFKSMDPYDYPCIATLFKQLLRDLGDGGLVPQSARDGLVKAAGSISSLRMALRSLPEVNRAVLKHLIAHLKRVSERSSKNKMNAHNLCRVFAPSLFPASLDATLTQSMGSISTNSGSTTLSSPNNVLLDTNGSMISLLEVMIRDRDKIFSDETVDEEFTQSPSPSTHEDPSADEESDVVSYDESETQSKSASASNLLTPDKSQASDKSSSMDQASCFPARTVSLPFVPPPRPTDCMATQTEPMDIESQEYQSAETEVVPGATKEHTSNVEKETDNDVETPISNDRSRIDTDENQTPEQEGAVDPLATHEKHEAVDTAAKLAAPEPPHSAGEDAKTGLFNAPNSNDAEISPSVSQKSFIRKVITNAINDLVVQDTIQDQDSVFRPSSLPPVHRRDSFESQKSSSSQGTANAAMQAVIDELGSHFDRRNSQSYSEDSPKNALSRLGEPTSTFASSNESEGSCVARPSPTEKDSKQSHQIEELSDHEYHTLKNACLEIHEKLKREKEDGVRDADGFKQDIEYYRNLKEYLSQPRKSKRQLLNEMWEERARLKDAVRRLKGKVDKTSLEEMYSKYVKIKEKIKALEAQFAFEEQDCILVNQPETRRRERSNTGNERDTAALLREKSDLKERIYAFKKEFLSRNGREPTTPSDKAPIAMEWQRYKEIRETLDALSQGRTKTNT